MKKKRKKGEALRLHKKLKGKVGIVAKGAVKTAKDLSVFYTPGVGEVSSYVGKYPKKAREYTIKGNTVAVVSDGSAVLGLGNIGPEGALPVMEGKAMLFKEFAGVNAFPIVLRTQDTEEIISIVKNIAPTFGGINLEDISAPRCFEIEERLKKELDIPVMHDDQHGTAIVVLAGLINASRVVKKNMKEMRFAIIGAGAAGSAVARILVKEGVKDVLVTDSKGIISSKNKTLSRYKKELARLTNRKNITGNAKKAVTGADAVIGVSGPGTITQDMICSMGEKPIVFSLANPIPEIHPDESKKAGAYVIATGRSDFPNQINNSLVFPGVFRGAFDNNVRAITDTMKVRAAHALAKLIKKPTRNRIVPTMFTKGVVQAVSYSIK